MGAEVRLERATDESMVQVWSWPSDGISAAAVPRLLHLIEALSGPHGLQVAQVVHGSVGADRTVVAFAQPSGRLLANAVAKAPLVPTDALACARLLVETLGQARALDVSLWRWDPAAVVVLPDRGGWVLPAPGMHGLPVEGPAEPRTQTEAAACAPELAAGAIPVDEAAGPALCQAESYALGATLFYALTGALPIEADSPAAYRAEQLEGEVRSVSDVAPTLAPYRELHSLMDVCLARSRQKRPHTIEELKRRVDVALTEAQRLDSHTSYLPLRMSDSVTGAFERPHQRGDEPAPMGQHWTPMGVMLVLVALLLLLIFFQTQSFAPVGEAPERDHPAQKTPAP